MTDTRPARPVIYGIPNCDTMKKARNWLQQQNIDYRFHDYKKQGVDQQQLRDWLNHFGWEKLINKRGTSWRKLDDETRNSMNEAMALNVMVDNPSIIKRPILQAEDTVLIGFDEAVYAREFNT